MIQFNCHVDLAGRVYLIATYPVRTQHYGDIPCTNPALRLGTSVPETKKCVPAPIMNIECKNRMQP